MARISKRTLAESYIIIFVVGLALGYLLFSGKQIIPEIIAADQLPGTVSAYATIVAVRSDGIGVVGGVDVEIAPGKGRVLINTNPFVEPDTQFSAETAVGVASAFTKKNVADRDIIFAFNINGTLIGGPSAGAAMAVAAIAAMSGKSVRTDAAITGTIESDGSIGPVGSVIEKAQAAGDNGVKLFLVPAGQANGTYYERRVTEEQRGNFVFRRVTYAPHTFVLDNFTTEQYGMDSKEVSKIEEAAALMVG